MTAVCKGSVAIVTGSSRGMGEAIALDLHARGAQVLGIARGTSAALEQAGIAQWQHDLADSISLAPRLQAWVAERAAAQPAGIWLINNAALISEPGPGRLVQAADAVVALRVGLEATVLLCQAFLEGASGFAGDKRVFNVSSGNGRRALAGTAVYSAIKAGMDHYSRVLALDEVASAGYTPARVASVAPGIIDTDMQTTLRHANPQRFAAQAMFAQYHAEGALWTPAAAGKRVVDFLLRDDFGSNPVADVRDV